MTSSRALLSSLSPILCPKTTRRIPPTTNQRIRQQRTDLKFRKRIQKMKRSMLWMTERWTAAEAATSVAGPKRGPCPETTTSDPQSQSRKPQNWNTRNQSQSRNPPPKSSPQSQKQRSPSAMASPITQPTRPSLPVPVVPSAVCWTCPLAAGRETARARLH